MRVKASTQTTSGDAARAFAYTYNADGTLETQRFRQRYPSGLVVAYEYDAAGRPKKVGKTTVGETDYAGGIVEEINGKEIDRGIEYAAHGGVKTLRLGNGLYESRGYNARLQPTAIRLGTEAGGSQKLALAFAYGTTANSGNVLSQTIGREGLSGTLTQHYRYDGANRLGLAAEGGTAPTSADGCPTDAVWCRDYGYDAYGNRAVTGTRGHTPATATPTATSAYSTTTNRITAGSYDEAGNLLSLAGVGALSYDGENRLTAYDNNVVSLQEQATYSYDGLGQRVKCTTTIRGTSETTVYVYDAFGRLAAEYSSVAPEVGTGGTFYRTEDHLGSTRLVTKQNQTVAECRDFFPFGERIDSGLNGRSADCYGAAGGAVKQQFTGKERDEESSLDYFGARYFSARLGRFTGPDEPLMDQFASAPQSWNLYSYVLNNPLRFLDPTGRKCVETDDGSVGDDGEGEMCQAVVEEGSQQETAYAYPQINPAAAQLLRSAAFRAENTFRAFVRQAVLFGAAGGFLRAVAASSKAFVSLGITVNTRRMAYFAAVQRYRVVFGQLKLSKHAVEKMAKEGITRGTIRKVITEGTRYWDPLHGNFRYILRGSPSKGTGISASFNPVTNNVVTVFKVSKIPSRLIPF